MTRNTLLGPNDPVPYEISGEERSSRWLVTADHAGEAIPDALGDMGVDAVGIDDHRWCDIGVADLARAVADRLEAPALLSTYSRLVIDMNRCPDAVHGMRMGEKEIPGCIVETVDGVPIPANTDLSGEEVQQRRTEIFDVYHSRQETMLKNAEVLISLHSFTPVLGETSQPFDVGVLWYEDQRLAIPFMENLRTQNPGFLIGDNEPYSLQNPDFWRLNYSTRVHAEEKGLANILIEVRNDKLGDAAGVNAMADILVQALRPVLADQGLG